MRAQGQRQVNARRPKYKCKTVASRAHAVWAADTVDYTAKPSEDGGCPHQYMLIVQDMRSRRIRAIALQAQGPAHAPHAFEHIVQSVGVPRHLDTDVGAEFKGPCRGLPQRLTIELVVVDPRKKNAREALDTAVKDSWGSWIGRRRPSKWPPER